MPLMPGGGARQYRAPGAGLPGAPLPLPRSSPTMMSMNSKQAFSMHPILHEPKYPHLHTSSEAIRRACLPAPQVSRTSAGVCFPPTPSPGWVLGGSAPSRTALPSALPDLLRQPTGSVWVWVLFRCFVFFLGGGVPLSPPGRLVRWVGGCSRRRGCSERGKGLGEPGEELAGPSRAGREQPSCPTRPCQPVEQRLCGTPTGFPPLCGCSLFWGGHPRGKGGCPGSSTLLLALLFGGVGGGVELSSSYLSQGQSGISITLLSF